MVMAKTEIKDELAALAERAGVAPAELAAVAADLEDEWEARRVAAAERAWTRVQAGAPCRTLEEVEPELRARLEERIAAAQK